MKEKSQRISLIRWPDRYTRTPYWWCLRPIFSIIFFYRVFFLFCCCSSCLFFFFLLLIVIASNALWYFDFGLCYAMYYARRLWPALRYLSFHRTCLAMSNDHWLILLERLFCVFLFFLFCRIFLFFPVFNAINIIIIQIHFLSVSHSLTLYVSLFVAVAFDLFHSILKQTEN